MHFAVKQLLIHKKLYGQSVYDVLEKKTIFNNLSVYQESGFFQE